MTTLERVPPELEFLNNRLSPEQVAAVAAAAIEKGTWAAAALVYQMGKQLKDEGQAVLTNNDIDRNEERAANKKVLGGIGLMNVARRYRTTHPNTLLRRW